jgi:hypothetical protein
MPTRASGRRAIRPRPRCRRWSMPDWGTGKSRRHQRGAGIGSVGSLLTIRRPTLPTLDPTTAHPRRAGRPTLVPTLAQTGPTPGAMG